ncbi:MAG: hypothetical protein ACD_9C00276G0005 [uncultured bacterium]|nr:MAG: hypothetical protein ACD_9C00276G0005 [uncultured bacterium]
MQVKNNKKIPRSIMLQIQILFIFFFFNFTFIAIKSILISILLIFSYCIFNMIQKKSIQEKPPLKYVHIRSVILYIEKIFITLNKRRHSS